MITSIALQKAELTKEFNGVSESGLTLNSS